MNEPMMQQPQGQPTPAMQEQEYETDAVNLFFESMATAIGVETVFGEPITAGNQVVIPVAESSMGGGVGMTYFPDEQGRMQQRVMRAGAGGGGGANTRPVAAIVISPEGVKVKTIIDVNRLALTGITSTAALWKGISSLVKALRKNHRR